METLLRNGEQLHQVGKVVDGVESSMGNHLPSKINCRPVGCSRLHSCQLQAKLASTTLPTSPCPQNTISSCSIDLQVEYAFHLETYKARADRALWAQA